MAMQPQEAERKPFNGGARTYGTVPRRGQEKPQSPSAFMACCMCCAHCCSVYAAAGCVMLLIFSGLIKFDNITFELQFKEHLREDNKNGTSEGPPVTQSQYDEYKNARAQACLVAAGIYLFVWCISIIAIRRKKRSQ